MLTTISTPHAKYNHPTHNANAGFVSEIETIFREEPKHTLVRHILSVGIVTVKNMGQKSQFMNGSKKWVLGLWILGGCAPQAYVIKSENIHDPSVTVIPNDGDFNFAGAVEREIGRLGIKVIERPVYKGKINSSDKSNAKTTTDSSTSKSQGKIEWIEDIASVYDDSAADYIAATYGSFSPQRIRVIRKKDKVVVINAEVNASDLGEVVFLIMTSAGLVQNSIDETSCKTKRRSLLYDSQRNSVF